MHTLVRANLFLLRSTFPSRHCFSPFLSLFPLVFVAFFSNAQHHTEEVSSLLFLFSFYFLTYTSRTHKSNATSPDHTNIFYFFTRRSLQTKPKESYPLPELVRNPQRHAVIVAKRTCASLRAQTKHDGHALRHTQGICTHTSHSYTK